MQEPERYLSTAEVANYLSVGVSTVKRWVEKGVLKAHKTVGGHRKLLWDDVLRLAKEENFALGTLAPQASVGALEPIALRKEFEAALREESSAAAQALMQNTYRSGASLLALADDVIAPVMARVGKDWQTGRIDVCDEHQRTQLCISALFHLKRLLEVQVRPGRPLALGGAPEGDPYLIPSLMIEIVLLEAGWRVVNFGPNVPLDSLARAIADERPKLVWLSASHLEDEPRFVREVRVLSERAKAEGALLVLGGQAIQGELAQSLTFATIGQRLEVLVNLAKGLHPPPRRPRLGRPRKS